MYTEKELKEISGNQLSIKYYERAVDAFNGLSIIFGKEWVENKVISYYHTDASIIKLLDKEKVYRGITGVEELVFLWEDIQLIKNTSGFEPLLLKLKGGFRNQNIDLEISVMADIIRCGGLLIEIEPEVGNNFSECKFSTEEDNFEVYVEITRNLKQSDIDEKGKKLAELVSKINPNKRCILVLTKIITDDEYLEVVEWLKLKPEEGEFNDCAIFFTVEHNADEAGRVFEYITPPVTIRQYGAIHPNKGFGVAYFHFPFSQAKVRRKLNDKNKQLPQDSQGLLFVDVTAVDGGFSDWGEQISFSKSLEHFSTVVLLRDGNFSTGFIREFKVIQNNMSKNPLSESTNKVLRNLSTVRNGWSLM